jgi:hypothetical protein
MAPGSALISVHADTTTCPTPPIELDPYPPSTEEAVISSSSLSHTTSQSERTTPPSSFGSAQSSSPNPHLVPRRLNSANGPSESSASHHERGRGDSSSPGSSLPPVPEERNAPAGQPSNSGDAQDPLRNNNPSLGRQSSYVWSIQDSLRTVSRYAPRQDLIQNILGSAALLLAVITTAIYGYKGYKHAVFQSCMAQRQDCNGILVRTPQ